MVCLKGYFEKNFSLICLIFICSFYFSISDFYKLAPYFLLFISVIYKYYKNVKLDVRVILFCCFVIFSPIIGDLVNIFYRDVTPLSSIEKVVRNLVLVLPVAVFFKVEEDFSFYAFLIFLGILFVTMIVSILNYYDIYSIENGKNYGSRVGLWWNPIPFSNAVVFFLASFSGIFMVLMNNKENHKKILHFCFCLGFLSAGVVIVLSGTRGSFLGYLFILMCVYAFLFVRLFQSHVVKVLSLLFVFFIVVIAVYLMRDGFMLAYHEFLRHFLVGPEFSSISIRLTVWSFSIEAFRENMFLGVGIDQIMPLKQSLIEKGYYPEYLISYHTHSDILDSMLRSGIIGLIGIVFLYMSPYVASKFFGSKVGNFLPVFILTSVVFLTGLFDSPLRNNVSVNSFYISYFVVFYVCLKSLNKSNVQ